MNRYDPRTIFGFSDSIQYFKLVHTGPQEAIGHWRYRVLVPNLTKPIQRLVQGHIGTWNDTAFGLLVVNSILVAASSLIIMLLGLMNDKGYAVAFFARLIYILNFSISNYHLSGLVDSAEGCFLLLVILFMISNNWKFLPILSILVGWQRKASFPCR